MWMMKINFEVFEPDYSLWLYCLHYTRAFTCISMNGIICFSLSVFNVSNIEIFFLNRFLIYKMRILPWKSTGQKSRKWRMRSRNSWRRSAGWRILWRRPRRTPPTSPVMKLVSGLGALSRRIMLLMGCTVRYLSQNFVCLFFHGTMFTWQIISVLKWGSILFSF